MSSKDRAATLVEQMGLQPHPEGGWYRETWRASEAGHALETGRAGGTAILFLLKAGERSHWHKVDAEEMWIWQGGDPLMLRLAQGNEGPVEDVRLGGNPLNGESLQGLVATGQWQAAEALAPGEGKHGYSLVSCVVVPGFEFSGFHLAPPGWEPGSKLSAESAA